MDSIPPPRPPEGSLVERGERSGATARRGTPRRSGAGAQEFVTIVDPAPIAACFARADLSLAHPANRKISKIVTQVLRTTCAERTRQNGAICAPEPYRAANYGRPSIVPDQLRKPLNRPDQGLDNKWTRPMQICKASRSTHLIRSRRPGQWPTPRVPITEASCASTRRAGASRPRCVIPGFLQPLSSPCRRIYRGKGRHLERHARVHGSWRRCANSDLYLSSSWR